MICRPLAVSARTGKTAPAASVKGAQPRHQKLPQPLFEHPHPQVTEAELPWPHPQEHPHDEEPEHPGIALMKEDFFLGIAQLFKTALNMADTPDGKEKR